MVKRKGIVLNEWVFILLAPKPGRRGPVVVEVENVEAGDRGMAEALAGVLQVWLNAAGGRR